MKIEEAYNIIIRCPYNFSEDEIEFNTSKLYEGRTCAMHWIRIWHTLPPHTLLHTATIKGIHGSTCAMQWIQYAHTLPPPEFLHDITLGDNDGCTCAIYWIMFVQTLPPHAVLRVQCIG